MGNDSKGSQSPQRVSFRDVKILRTGTFTDVSGQRVTFDAKYLEELAENFDPEDEPQLNIDHKREGRSYGSIGGLRYTDGWLLADIHNVPEELSAEFMAGGAFPNRSTEVHRIRKQVSGLALLGAKPPAVKRLGPIRPEQLIPQVAFSEPDGDDFTEFTLEEQEGNNMSDLDTTRLAEEAGQAKAKLESAEVRLAEYDAKISELAERDKEREAKFAELEEKNRQLMLSEAERAAELKFAEATASAGKFIDELGAKATPAMKSAGLDTLLATLDLSGLKVKDTPAGKALRAILLAAPDFLPPAGEQDQTDLAEGEPELDAATLAIAARIYKAGTPEYEDHLKRLKADKGEGK